MRVTRSRVKTPDFFLEKDMHFCKQWRTEGSEWIEATEPSPKGTRMDPPILHVRPLVQSKWDQILTDDSSDLNTYLREALHEKSQMLASCWGVVHEDKRLMEWQQVQQQAPLRKVQNRFIPESTRNMKQNLEGAHTVHKISGASDMTSFKKAH